MPLSDYKRKKKLAERLRRSADAFGTMAAPDPTVATPSSGAFPGQIQANWFAPLAQMAQAYAGTKVAERADTAEAEAEAERMRALQSIFNPQAGAQGAGNAPGQPGTMGAAQGQPSMDPGFSIPGVQAPGSAPIMTGDMTPGQAPQPGTMGAGRLTPEQLITLQELGVDPGMVKLMMPQEMNAAAYAQAMGSPEGRMALRLKGELTEEQYQQAEQAAAARAAAATDAEKEMLRYKASLERAPQNDISEFEYWMSQNPGADISDFYKAKGLSKGGGKGGGKGASSQEDRASVIANIDEADRLINDPKNKDMFGWGQRLVGAGIDWKNQNPGDLLPLLANTVVGPLESTGAAALRRLGTEQSFARVKELYPASNADIALARSLSANINQSKEAAQAYVNQMRRMYALYPLAFEGTERQIRGGPGQADGEGVGAGAGRDEPSDAEMEEFYNRGR